MTVREYRTRRIRKAISALLVLGGLTYGLFLFTSVEDSINNFKPAYATRIYWPVWKLLASELAKGDLRASYQTEEASPALSIPVLLYHGVVDKADGENVTLDQFRDQMFVLKNAGYETVNISDFYLFIQGRKQLPEKSFLLTFDDGRKDSYYPVDPLLSALDYRAVMFVITKHSLGGQKSDYYLSRRELQKMIKSGRWEIQAHAREGHNLAIKVAQDGTQGHYYSNKLWLNDQNRLETSDEYTERVKADVIAARDEIRQNLGVEVISFAFPFGDYGQSSINFPESESIVRDIVASTYSLSFYQTRPSGGFSLNFPQEEQTFIKRLDVKPEWSSDDLLKVLEKVGGNNTN